MPALLLVPRCDSENRAACVLEAVVHLAVMALADRRILTFDVVGTLIDFEAGILGCLRGIVDRAGIGLPHSTLLAELARAEDGQQQVAPALPFMRVFAYCGGRQSQYHDIARRRV
jgi:hypothetical protein